MQLENHGVDAAIMEDVKRFVLGHYEEHLEAKFHASHLAGNLDAAQVDWEAAYSIHHRLETNIADFTEISPATRYAAVVYITRSSRQWPCTHCYLARRRSAADDTPDAAPLSLMRAASCWTRTSPRRWRWRSCSPSA